jgi:hypothetical protein
LAILGHAMRATGGQTGSCGVDGEPLAGHVA